MRKKNSFRDSKDKLWVACCECDRGGNGNDKDKCSCGWRVKTWHRKEGCFLGKVLTEENNKTIIDFNQSNRKEK